MLAAACSGGTEAASKGAQNATASAADVKSPSPKAVEAAANPDAADTDKTTPPAASKESSVNELQSHIPSGSKLLDSKIGDLDGDGRPDALLVLDHGTGNEKLGEGSPRTIVVLVRDANGALRKVAQNDKLVPCETCGGVVGDPFGYVRVENGRFTVAVGGGSRERWSDDYTFAYADGDWFVDQVLRSVSDPDTGAEKQKAFTAKEIGKVRFGDFDPTQLEQVTL
jgi:hypothetical protein